MAKTNWLYIGCSIHSVPSLSKVATRSSGLTKSGPPSLVTLVTKSMMLCLVAPSFQDGSGSSAARASVAEQSASNAAAKARRFIQGMVIGRILVSGDKAGARDGRPLCLAS